MSEKLSAEQLQILRWIDENPQTRSEWNDDGTHRTVSGPNGSITMSLEDSRATLDYVQPMPFKSRSLFELSPAGRAALEREEG